MTKQCRIVPFALHMYQEYRVESVGAEYIIMEKVDGIPLANTWSNLRPPFKLKIMLQIFEYQKRWSAICFSRYGSLYYAKDVNTPLSETLYTEDGVAFSNPKFVVGPAVGREWSDEGRRSLKCRREPCRCFPVSPNFDYDAYVGMRREFGPRLQNGSWSS